MAQPDDTATPALAQRGPAGWWVRFHRQGWYLRWTVKGAVLVLAVFAVCYPYPRLLWRNVQHWRNPNALIEPNAPELGPLLGELRPRLDPSWDGPRTLQEVQLFVCEKVPYAWDWVVWGVVDYMPTVREVLAAGREDCDGRAVVAASLLRGLGYDAQLVADGVHVWVWTPQGETMGPHAIRTVTATEKGLRFDWRGLRVLPRGFVFGIGVFPTLRELIVLAVLWVVLMAPGIGVGRALACAVLLGGGLVCAKLGADNYYSLAGWATWMTVALLLAGILAAKIRRRRPAGETRPIAAAE